MSRISRGWKWIFKHIDSITNIKRRTTTTFELALPILFTSGIQHIAEKPEGMAKMPGYVVEFLKNIPVQWDEVRFLSGFPGKDIALARRHGETWYVVAINGEPTAKTMQLDLSFLAGKTGVLFSDGEKTAVPIKKKEVRAGKLEIGIAPHGGVVMKF
ncbi:MAG: glycoside hydrolase family 97 C-terminal domain-containing protein [Bacteroidota bacterium]